MSRRDWCARRGPTGPQQVREQNKHELLELASAICKTAPVMVWFNDKARGVRLGHDTSLGLSISCTRCSRIARIRLDVALRLWGERTFSRDIARDLRCSKCGVRAACVHVISDSRPAWVIAEDPGGGFLMGPSYPIIEPPFSLAWKAVRKRGWL